MADSLPERYDELCAEVGPQVVDEAERLLALFHLDRIWSDHLAELADLREGIHLVRVGGRDPLQEFGRRASEMFYELSPRIDDAVVQSLRTATITAEGIDLEREGLRGPSSTWTYIIADDPFRDKLGRQANRAGRARPSRWR